MKIALKSYLMKSFWQDFPKPFFAMAPLDDVSDTVFRRVVMRAARPDVFFTEFANADAFVSAGRPAVEKKLRFENEESPLIVQIWGKFPEHYYEMAKAMRERGFAGIDINMGCPDKNIVRSGVCSALIKGPVRAAEIIKATQEGAGELPVSVKTRIGFSAIATEEWIGHLLGLGLDALTIHGRTTKEMSKVPAHWDEIGRAVQLRDEIAPDTVIIGNGDIESRAQGEELAREYGVDGLMIGRGVFHDIYVFESGEAEHSVAEHVELLNYHLDLFESTWGEQKSYEPLKKFFKIYLKSFPGANDLRASLMETKSIGQAREILAKMPQDQV